MTHDARMFNSINTNSNDGYDSITFGDNGKGKVKGLGKIAISNDMSIYNVLLVELELQFPIHGSIVCSWIQIHIWGR